MTKSKKSPVGMRRGTRPRSRTHDVFSLAFPASVRRVRWCAWFGVAGWPARLLRQLAAAQISQLGRTKRVAAERLLIDVCGHECKQRCHADPAEEIAERAAIEAARREDLLRRQEAARARRRARRARERRREASGGSGEVESL